MPHTHNERARRARAIGVDQELYGRAAVIEAGSLCRQPLVCARPRQQRRGEPGTSGDTHLVDPAGGDELDLQRRGGDRERTPDEQVAGDERRGPGERGTRRPAPRDTIEEQHRGRDGRDHHPDHHDEPHEKGDREVMRGPQPAAGPGHGHRRPLEIRPRKQRQPGERDQRRQAVTGCKGGRHGPRIGAHLRPRGRAPAPCRSCRAARYDRAAPPTRA